MYSEKVYGIERLGIESQTVFGMPPVDYVLFASRLGCTDISLGLVPPPWNPCDFPAWSLRDDPALRRRTLAALNDTGVAISAVEGFAIRAGGSLEDRLADLDICYEMGVSRVNTVSLDASSTQTMEQLARLADLAAERDMVVGLEFAPPHTIPDLDSALQLINILEKSNLRLIIDAMHFFRSGGSATDLTALPSNLIACVQLCDAPLSSQDTSYMNEACFERMISGTGELPLLDLLSAIPSDVLVGVETPMLAEAQSGQLEQTVTRSVASARMIVSMARQMAKEAI